MIVYDRVRFVLELESFAKYVRVLIYTWWIQKNTIANSEGEPPCTWHPFLAHATLHVDFVGDEKDRTLTPSRSAYCDTEPVPI